MNKNTTFCRSIAYKMKSKKCQFQQRKSVNKTDNEAAQLPILSSAHVCIYVRINK